jgi:DNA (cytosine-5)-methyltransferase 1
MAIVLKDSHISLIDGFCGAGGSSLGCETAGATVKLAMNHNEKSLATHAHNFPHAMHAKVDISAEDPKKYPHATMLWMSPECTNHSTSKGIKLLNQNQLTLWTDREEDPFVERSRATMWDVVRWAEGKKEQGHPFELIFVENITKVPLWGGYLAWLKSMKNLGYEYKTVYYNSQFADPFPASVPQSRDRWYCVFWRKGNNAPNLDLRPAAYCQSCAKDIRSVQSWKNPSRPQGDYKRQYVYRCPVCAKEVVPHYASAATLIDWSIPTQKIGERSRPLKEKTMKRIELGLERYGQVPLLVETSRTMVESNFSRPVTEASFTQTTGQTVGVAIPPAFLMSYYGNTTYKTLDEPLGTCTSRDRHALVTFPETSPAVEDCGFRMLNLNEVKRAMGFPVSYKLVCSSAREGVRQCGLAVTPAVARELVQRGIESLGYSVQRDEVSA